MFSDPEIDGDLGAIFHIQVIPVQTVSRYDFKSVCGAHLQVIEPFRDTAALQLSHHCRASIKTRARRIASVLDIWTCSCSRRDQLQLQTVLRH